jgi:lysine 2,3-aminomutase
MNAICARPGPARRGAAFETLAPWLKARLAGLDDLLERYPPAVTPYYLSLANPDDPADPIAAQFLPTAAELASLGEGDDDPLAESAQSPLPGLVHRYPDRVLMIVTDDCFVRCRHCNRRRLWADGGGALSDERLEAMLDYLRRTPSVREAIVSGGDPLTLTDERLDIILTALGEIPNIETIRLHTRAPVVLPERISAELQAVLSRHAPVWVNTHFNHPREVTPAAAAACLRLLRAGSPVGNQTVLLRGINDNAETILDLCRSLQAAGVRPYYLFSCDPVRGTAHFRSSVAAGLAIIARLRDSAAGLAVPSFAVDLPGGWGKVVLGPEGVAGTAGGEIFLRTASGEIVTYPEAAPPPAGSEW